MAKQPISASEVTVEDQVNLLEEAQRLQEARGQVAAQLDIADFRLELIKKIMAANEARGGEALSAEVAGAAVDKYLSGLYSHQAIQGGLPKTVATLYVLRDQIFKKVVLPMIVAAGIVGVGALTVSGVTTMIRNGEEAGVEQAITADYQLQKSMSREASALGAVNTMNDSQLANIVSVALADIAATDPFFQQYCPDNDCKAGVTSQNYKDVKGQLPGIEGKINAVGMKISEGREVVAVYQKASVMGQTLDGLIQNIRDQRPPSALLAKAEEAYAQAKADLTTRNLNAATTDKAKLEQVGSDITMYVALKPQAEQLCKTIESIAKEQAAQDQRKAMCTTAANAATGADVATLKTSVEQLTYLRDVLNQSYTLTIVNREGVKTGVERSFDANNNVSGVYLVVEAIGPDGRALTVRIKNEENGNYTDVRMWGEKVPQCVYDRVKADKMDDGILQGGDVMGKKEPGYLTYTITMPGCDGNTPFELKGEITDW